MNKMLVVSDNNDQVVIMAYPDTNGKYVIVEPADGSLKLEIYNNTEPFFKDVDGNVFIDRSRFIFRR